VVASDGTADAELGWSVAMSSDGNTAILGADIDDIGSNTNQGSAYVFTRSGGLWIQQQKLTASDGATGTTFGCAVALSSDGNTAIIGAQYDASSQGAAYVFTRSGTVWTQQQKLTAGVMTGWFGISVGLSGDGNTAIVGAPSETVRLAPKGRPTCSRAPELCGLSNNT